MSALTRLISGIERFKKVAGAEAVDPDLLAERRADVITLAVAAIYDICAWEDEIRQKLGLPNEGRKRSDYLAKQ